MTTTSEEQYLPPAPVAEELSSEAIAFSKGGNLFWYGDPTEKRGFDCDLYTYPQPAVPEGWRLVPEEPTEEMLCAANQLTTAPVMEFKNWPTGHHVVWECLPYGTHKLYTHPQPAVPEGWKLVPVNPTDAIFDDCQRLWRSMLAATPSAPAKPAVPDVEALAKYLRGIHPEEDRWPMHTQNLAGAICNWIEEQKQ